MTQALTQILEETSGLTQLFQDFLAAYGDPEGGGRLYDFYAEDAPVSLDGRLCRKRDVDRASFAEAHRHVGMDGNARLPVFERIVFLAASGEGAGSRAVGWFEVREAGDHRQVTVACGFLHENGLWRVGWCVVATSKQDWLYQGGLLQTLAEYQWICSDQAVITQGSLDGSYIRLYRQPNVQLFFLPETRFSCHMTGACCKTDYGVVLPGAAQLLIDALPWEDIRPALKGTQLAVRPDGQLQLKDNHETCRFLDEHTQCLVHKFLGRQPFGPCAVFPFGFAKTPEGVAVTTSHICGSVRNGRGPLLSERQDIVSERLFLAKVRTPNGFRLAPGLDIPWETFCHVEEMLLDLLAESHIPLYRRLYVGNRILDALRKNEELEVSAWLEEPPGVLTEDLREEMRTYFARILAWDRLALKRLPQDMSLDLHHERLHDESVVVAILQKLLFSKVYSYPFDLATAHNLAIVLYVLTLALQSVGDGDLTDELWRELASLGGHGLLSSLLPDSAPPNLVAFLGSSEFGQWALWFPQS